MTKNTRSDETVALHSYMQDRQTLFCYSGPMNEELLTTMSNPVKHQISDKETQEALSRRVFGVFIEQAQNIIRYSHHKTKSSGDSIGTIAISVIEDGFLIEAVNVIAPDEFVVPTNCFLTVNCVSLAPSFVAVNSVFTGAFGSLNTDRFFSGLISFATLCVSRVTLVELSSSINFSAASVAFASVPSSNILPSSSVSAKIRSAVKS